MRAAETPDSECEDAHRLAQAPQIGDGHDANDEGTGNPDLLPISESILTSVVGDDIGGKHRADAKELAIERRHDRRQNAGREKTAQDGSSLRLD